jgi:hypothetical protein
MNKILQKIGQIGFFLALGEFVFTLIIEMIIITTIRAFQKYILKDKKLIKSISYYLVKYHLHLALKLNGMNIIVTKPVS